MTRACIERLPDGRGCPNYIDRPNTSRCADHRAAYERKRNRSPSSAVSQTHRWRRVRQAIVAERQRPDGTWTCELCRLPIADPRDIDVDHKKPVAEGGEPYDRENLRVAHRSCNRRAGGKLRAERKRTGLAAARARRTR